MPTRRTLIAVGASAALILGLTGAAATSLPDDTATQSWIDARQADLDRQAEVLALAEKELADRATPEPTPSPVETTEPPASGVQLLVSTAEDRSNPVPLDGATLVDPADAYVFATPDSTVDAVTFVVNGDPNTTYTENTAPFDLRGADPITDVPNALALDPGTHTVTADLAFTTATHVETITATFTVAEPTTTSSGDGIADPPPTGVVDPASTGVPAGTDLTPAAGFTVTTDGAVIEGLDISGQLVIDANNVTVRNAKVTSGTSSYVIYVRSGNSGTLIEHVSAHASGQANGVIGGMGDGQCTAGKTAGANVTVRHSSFTGDGDGVKVANCSLYESNYVKVRRGPDSVKHIDGFQASGRNTFTIRGNYVDQAYSGGHNAAVFVQSYTGTQDNPVYDVLVEGNYLNGGVYTLHSGNGKKANPGTWFTNVRADGNFFGRDYKYGVVHSEGIAGTFGVWADNGQTVPTGNLTN